MAHQAPLKYIFYIAATPEKVWEGFVSRESNRIIFSGAELQADFKPGGLLAWVGAGPDGKPMTYVRGKVLRFEVDRKSTRLNSSHTVISYAVFCLIEKRTDLNVSRGDSTLVDCRVASVVRHNDAGTDALAGARAHAG